MAAAWAGRIADVDAEACAGALAGATWDVLAGALLDAETEEGAEESAELALAGARLGAVAD